LISGANPEHLRQNPGEGNEMRVYVR
jgi:hypothetical protein